MCDNAYCRSIEETFYHIAISTLVNLGQYIIDCAIDSGSYYAH